MASIPANVIFVWTGTNATIPGGWSRETTLDDKHAKAWGTENPNTTGGAATHTHTSPGHSHALGAHTHTYTTNTVGPSGNTTGAGGGSVAIGSHNHTGTSGAISGGTTNVTAVTYGAVSNDPPYRKVIFIKASAGAQLATNTVALYNSNTPPSNWSNVSELQGRYLKGSGAGADADLATDNGSSTNSHDITHTHTTNTHTHAAANTNNASMTGRDSQAGTYVTNTHAHSATLGAGTQAINQNTDTLVTSETVEPAYAILQAIKKGASGVKEIGIIGLWLGTVATIPQGWIVCDGTNSTKDLRDKFIKIGDPAGANGGANTHTHAAQAHSHTGSGTHTHSGTTGTSLNLVGTNNTGTTSVPDHSHSFTSDAGSANYAAANTTADSSANQPSYRTAAYIQFQKEISNGTFLLSMI